MKLKDNMCESHISKIRLFIREGSVNCVIVRSGGEQTCAVLAGRNESEPHRMSLENYKTREPSPSSQDEGRRELPESSVGKPGCKQLLAIQRSGGVGEGSMSGSIYRINWETFQSEGANSTANASLEINEVCWALEGVGVLHSSDEAVVMMVERRRGTYVYANQRREGSGDGE